MLLEQVIYKELEKLILSNKKDKKDTFSSIFSMGIANIDGVHFRIEIQVEPLTDIPFIINEISKIAHLPETLSLHVYHCERGYLQEKNNC